MLDRLCQVVLQFNFRPAEFGPNLMQIGPSVITAKPAIREQVKTGQWEAVRD
jgi:hypothetical protein